MNKAISITNHSDVSIEITIVHDNAFASGERKKIATIPPKDSFVFFTDRVEALSWTKVK